MNEQCVQVWGRGTGKLKMHTVDCSELATVQLQVQKATINYQCSGSIALSKLGIELWLSVLVLVLLHIHCNPQ